MKYIPEITVRGCYCGCPFYEYMDHADYCNNKKDWVRITPNDNVPKNDWIDKDCPLADKPRPEW